jgi:wobble nucleotide-excising tRNase
MNVKENFDKLLLKIIDENLKHIFGEAATSLIYNHLERNHSLKREEIPEKLEDFIRALEEFLGSGAQVVQKITMQKLSSCSEVRCEVKDCVTEIKNKL